MTSLQQLRVFVFDQKKRLFIRDVCRLLDLHVSEARKIVKQFVDEEVKKGSDLDVRYIVSGTEKGVDDEYKVQRFKSIKAGELEEAKKGFETLSSCEINYVSLASNEDQMSSIFEVTSEPLLSKQDLIKQQKLTYIINDDINIREDRLERFKLISGISIDGCNEDNKVKQEKKDEVKEAKDKTNQNESKSVKEKNKSTNKQTKGKKQVKNQKKLKFAVKDVKTEKSNNSSGDSGISIESTPDPFSDEEEKREEKEEMEFEPAPPSPKPDSDEEPIPSKKIKHHDSDDEAIVIKETKKKAKKENKKRKRVRVYDSDEEDEETLAMKILGGEAETEESASKDSIPALSEDKDKLSEKLSSKQQPERSSSPCQRMETRTIKEEFEDEDGYTQVKLVKKLVPISEEITNGSKKSDGDEMSESDKIKDESEGKKENNIKKEKPEKRAHKKLKTEDDEVENDDDKPKAKKLSKAAQARKGQVSITNFFKPANKS